MTSRTQIPPGRGKPPTFVPSGGSPPHGFDKFNPYVWDVYPASIEASASTTPWMFATGNHDREATYPVHGYGGQSARLDFPDNGPTVCPSAYTFVYGNVAVLSLDANDVTYEITANIGYSGGAQSIWVETALAAHRADPNIDFIVCFFHHWAYSTTEAHDSDGVVRAARCDFFDRYQWIWCYTVITTSSSGRTRFARAGRRRSLPTTGPSTPTPRRHRLLHGRIRRAAPLRLPGGRVADLSWPRSPRDLRAEQLRVDAGR